MKTNPNAKPKTQDSRPLNNTSQPLIGTAFALTLAALVSCQETRITGYQRPLRPTLQRPEAVPADARVDALVLTVSITPIDTNANGYPDLLDATAHLFDTRYRPTIREQGAFVFLLFAPGEAGRPDSKPIRRWRIEGEKVLRSQIRSAFGVGYHFRPSLLDGGTDMLPFVTADLVCYFEPADGRDPVYAGEVRTIQVGRRVLVPQARSRQMTEPYKQTTEEP